MVEWDPHRGRDDREWQLARNEFVINEYRSRGDVVRTPPDAYPEQIFHRGNLLLHTKGRKSGAPQVCPLSYLKVFDGWAVFAANSGSQRTPQWYYNVLAEPQITVEVGQETFEVVAREAVGVEREDYIARQSDHNKYFALAVEEAHPREIAVLILAPQIDAYRGADDAEWQISRNVEAITEYRVTGGKRPSRQGAQLLLHTIGRRSGEDRVSPLAYQKIDSGWVVFAAASGSKVHPAWYLNIVENPKTTIELGTETINVLAREAVGEERKTYVEAQMAKLKHFSDSVHRAAPREIPAIVLEPTD